MTYGTGQMATKVFLFIQLQMFIEILLFGQRIKETSIVMSTMLGAPLIVPVQSLKIALGGARVILSIERPFLPLNSQLSGASLAVSESK